MKRSTNRILTTHAGRLDPPRELTELRRALQRRESTDHEALAARAKQAVADIVREQKAIGLDQISDGEVTKYSSFDYYSRRMSGLSVRALQPNEPPGMFERTGERIEFAEFYGTMPLNVTRERMSVSGPLSFIGADLVKSDIDNMKSAQQGPNVEDEDVFMCVLAPGWLEHWMYNEYYKTDEEYLFAIADAVAPEYKAITDAGYILQLDDPGLPDTYDMIVPTPSIPDYRKFAELRVEALNHALRGLPEDQIRYHICWGSWHGPHTHDLPLKHVVDIMLRVTAGAYSVEAANPRHEHEWKVWRDTKLPDGKILVPGVVSHASNVVEHPELVADRIVQYANLVGRENVIASTDCGMGGRVHPQIGWAKLKALVEGAQIASKQLW
ncbi:MAG TPA: cobalamin-independent methionine synthase II family protein [Dehalococcoidia bacterium]|nr:cobalamin-independent methionine synthase II family protein [Dehalococcoidia bacterium]